MKSRSPGRRKEMKRNLTIRVTDEEIEWLQKEARAQMRTVANFILYVLNLYRGQKGMSSGVPSGTMDHLPSSETRNLT